jgi:hypothetical protein
MERIDADRGLGGPTSFHVAYRDGLARTFGACHEPIPARMQELIQQLGEHETLMDHQREAALGDASALAEYYAGALPRRRR